MAEPYEKPKLRAFLESLQPGDVLPGAVAAIEPFGVLVVLDEGPEHPTLPGVGLIALPDLSWRRFKAASDVVRIGERVSCVFLQSDTWNSEARLSLRLTQPDPFQTFAEGVEVGSLLTGRVTELLAFGVILRFACGVEGLVHQGELGGTSERSREAAVHVGDTVTVVVTGLDRERRTLSLVTSAKDS
ncbi:S1 RNA-binding domain-containing protein [Streptomyces sp. NPDC002793]|uniref:S1 RNA-binding domain-containing protein n=1 Tax=Streptomyces sp. NPDC002793 TaxID=3154432 RepID=UPI00332379FA